MKEGAGCFLSGRLRCVVIGESKLAEDVWLFVGAQGAVYVYVRVNNR